MGRRRAAYRAVAFVFASTALFFLAIFFYDLLGHHQRIRSGAFTYALVAAITAVGLWRERGWGRSVALVVALGTNALGVLGTLSSLIFHRGPLLAAMAVFVVSALIVWALNLPVFSHDE